MNIRNFKMLQIGWSPLPCLLLVGLIGWAHAPKAEPPSVPSRAVKSLNFTGLAEFRLTREDRGLGLDTTTGKEGLFGGWVTAPIGEHFGIRLALDGGIGAVSPAEGRSSVSLLNTGGDLFLRNPSKGYVQLGYRWNVAWWGDQTARETGDFMGSVHRLGYEVGFFHGDYDLEFGVEYLRLTREATVTTLPTGDSQSFSYPSQNGFRLLGGSTWYASDSLALGFDVEWGRRKVENPPDEFPDAHLDRFQARLGVDWQPPVVSLGARATVGLSVGLGYHAVPVTNYTYTSSPEPGGSQTETTLRNAYLFSYDIRLGVTVYFPGTFSLKERARQYQ